MRRVYSIRDKRTGKFLLSGNVFLTGRWDATGTKWRKPDTIRKYLKRLMHDWEWVVDNCRSYAKATGYFPERLANYEVVAFDTPLGTEEALESINFMDAG